ncbi:MAG: hypothetical protein ACXWWL_05260 [Candidatus Limnocylindria bacterium]
MAARSATIERVRGDVIEQRMLDRHRGTTSKTFAGPGKPVSRDLLTARMRSVVEALAQPNEPYAQRQALVDLAATAMELAAAYPTPTAARVNGHGHGVKAC